MKTALRILITGGGGYLGSVMVPQLMGAGHDVTVVDNFLYKQSSLNHCCADPRFNVVRGDVRDGKLMKSLLSSADLVIPLAALVGAPLCDADITAAKSVNQYAIQEMVKLLSPDQWVIAPISNSGYGVGERKDDGTPVACTEATPMRPISLYGQTKVEAENAIMGRRNAISLRLATVFGASPRMRIDLLVNDFVYRAVNDRFVVLFESRAVRNYIHVLDVARAFIHAIDNFSAMKGDRYNVGLSDANISKWDLCERIQKYIPEFYFTEADIGSDPDKRDYLVSNEKIEKTGFKPKASLDFGIIELIKLFRMIRNTRYGNV